MFDVVLYFKSEKCFRLTKNLILIEGRVMIGITKKSKRIFRIYELYFICGSNINLCYFTLQDELMFAISSRYLEQCDRLSIQMVQIQGKNKMSSWEVRTF